MILAVLATGLAVWAAFDPRRPITRLSVRPPAVEAVSRTSRAIVPAVVLAVLVAAVVGGIRIAVLVGLGALVTATAWILWGRYRARLQQREHRVGVAEGCALLAREVRAGRPPVEALLTVAEDHPPFARAASAHRVGGSVADSLRQAAALPGQAGMVQLARAWEVSARTGAALGPTLDVVAAGLRADQRVARTTAGELAAPRATGQVLGLLPVAGIVIGYVLGGNPIDFLINSSYGLVCLVGGVGLTCAGLLWSDWLGGQR
ncbi:type II secretion system F family protein [Enemella sp. A6]|uniref:type II secretion system F family protein n=1 Tax=Enemella sp. A6 TaxID=3440152 RepID=UPI003EC00402